MNRSEFIKGTSFGIASLLINPSLVLGKNNDFLVPNVIELPYSEEVGADWLFDIIFDVSSELIGKGVYAVCVAGIKNPNICKAVEYIAKTAMNASKEQIKTGLAGIYNDLLYYRIQQTANTTKINLKTRTINNALDATSVTTYCSGSWKYLKDLGVYPNASRNLLQAKDVSNLTKQQLFIMRNEIYARQGYEFQTPKAKDYFQKQSWYRNIRDKTQDSNYIYSHVFSNIERNNVELIKQYE